MSFMFDSRLRALRLSLASSSKRGRGMIPDRRDAEAAVEVTVGAAVRVAVARLPSALLSDLQQALSVPNPACAVAERRRASIPGHLARNLVFLERQDGFVELPRGALPLLRSFAVRHGVELRVRDQRVWPSERLGALPAVPLRRHQRRALAALLRAHQGVFRLPAGAGKTRCAIAAMGLLRTPTLVLVASLDLAEQWRAEITALLGVSTGIVGGGERRVEPITVATVQTLARWDARELDAFLARCGLLVIDEAHHLPSPTFRRVAGRCPARYRLGLTATPEREDTLTPVLEWFCGPVLSTVTHRELIEAGSLVAPEIRELRTTFEFDYAGPDDWMPLVDGLCRDDARNALIVSTVAAEARAGHIVLVLTGRVEHARLLAGRLCLSGVVARALVGAMSKRERSQALQGAREGRISVLVATSLADEGLDLPCLSRCVLTFPAKAAGRVEQRLGRIMRPHPEKGAAILIDVVDARVGVLLYQARKRAAVFARVLGDASRRSAA